MAVSRWLGMPFAGAVLATAFPPFTAPWPVIVLAVAYWFIATRHDSALTAIGRTLLFQGGFFLVLLRWMQVVGWDAWVLLALLEALFFVPLGWLRSRLHHSRFVVPVVIIAWVLTDVVRDNAPSLDFGWGQLAFASVTAPWAQLAPLGESAVTALALLAALGIGSLREDRPALGVFTTGIGICALAVPLAITAAQPAAESPVIGTGRARIALVQGGVQHTGLGFLGDPRDVAYRHAQTTEAARPLDVDLVVWPENAADVDPYLDAASRNAVLAASNAVQRPILFGAVLSTGEYRRNAALLADPTTDELRTVYTKQRLVPFGEYLPARPLIERLTSRAELLPRDFAAGTRSGSVRAGAATLGVVICFEIADEGIVRAAARGADGIVVLTNNATYYGRGQSQQQLRIAQLRALQARLPVYVVSTTGPSAVIDANGRIGAWIEEGATGVLTAVVP